MKKLIFIILLITFISSVKITTYAVSLTPEKTNTPTPTNESSNQLDYLKSKIASKVAELKLTEKRGTIGIVVENNNTQITIKDYSSNKRFVDVDELTKFSSNTDDNFGISDIKEGDLIGILGIYNKQSRRILAREISSITIPKFINGVVTKINEEDFYLTIVSDSQKEIIIEVENITKTFSYNNNSGLLKSGFSKIQENTNILLVGYPDKKDENRIIASRIVLLPELPRDPKITIAPEALEQGATIIPSTGSGKKLTPIVKD